MAAAQVRTLHDQLKQHNLLLLVKSVGVVCESLTLAPVHGVPGGAVQVGR